MNREIPADSSRLNPLSRARWAALLLGLWVTTLAPVASAQGSQDTCALGTQSLSFSLGALGVSPQASGGAPLPTGILHPDVDTGSAVLALPSPLLKDAEPISSLKAQPQPAATHCVTYSSSGNKLAGEWVWASVSFFDGETLRGTVKKMPVLSVRYACSAAKSRSGKPATPSVTSQARKLCQKEIPSTDVCTELDATSTVGMMGIQFGFVSVSAEYNALRQLANSIPGLSPGYVFSDGKIHVGLTEENTRGFTWLPLQPSQNSSPGFPDWKSPSACFRIGTGAQAWTSPPGTLLVDTGLQKMYLAAPSNLWPKFGKIPPGTPITILAPCDGGSAPALSYTFNMPAAGASQAPAPSEVISEKATQGVFINTGRHLLEQWNYAYDAKCGRVGFKKRT